MANNTNQAGFASKLGAILAAAGSAVGLAISGVSLLKLEQMVVLRLF